MPVALLAPASATHFKRRVSASDCGQESERGEYEHARAADATQSDADSRFIRGIDRFSRSTRLWIRSVRVDSNWR
ncbi:hypothetical protein GCM10007209_06120 [Haloferax sulfurifontis]|uniref:Uncharacterized protein n=1 Tax=Haloferax sulfurifontis TaxID=255616 RepID=A0A830E6K6_9EURY|nr:hypothetical protein GCM10007209_06120 [Haloferax sulfurifontis]